MIIAKALFGTGADGIDLVDHKHDLDGRDGFKMDLKLKDKGVKFDGDSNQPLSGPIWPSNQAH